MLEDECHRRRYGGQCKDREISPPPEAMPAGKRSERAQRCGKVQTAASGADRPFHAVRVKRAIVALVTDKAGRQIDDAGETGTLVLNASTCAHAQQHRPQNRRRDETFDHARLKS